MFLSSSESFSVLCQRQCSSDVLNGLCIGLVNAASCRCVGCYRKLLLPHDATQSAVLLWQVICPSVSLSVTLRNRDHIGWNTSKMKISQLVSLGCLLFACTNVMDLLQM